MAIKRTKKQKQQAAVRHDEILSYSLADLKTTGVVSAVGEKQRQTRNQQLKEIFDPSYLKKDLIKTLVVTTLVVGVLIAYTSYQR